jgi:hypothetical protein
MDTDVPHIQSAGSTTVGHPHGYRVDIGMARLRWVPPHSRGVADSLSYDTG